MRWDGKVALEKFGRQASFGPCRSRQGQSEWFEALRLSNADEDKIAAANARTLLKLD